MKVLDGLLPIVSDETGSWFKTFRTGELARPRGGIVCPAAEGAGSFHDGKSLTLDWRDAAVPLAKKLAEDLRSGTSFIGRLSVLVALLPNPRCGVTGLEGGESCEVFSMSATPSGEVCCDIDFETFRSFAPSSSLDNFLRTVPSFEEPDTSRISESSRMRWRENALRGR
jgi:hypothetical protein